MGVRGKTSSEVPTEQRTVEAVLCHEDHVPDCVRGDVLFHRRREAADHGALPGTAPVNQGRDAKVNINSERCVNPGCALLSVGEPGYTCVMILQVKLILKPT